jgi:hypothetical protein
VKGYAVVTSDELVEIPYPAGAEGRSFHHSRFITSFGRPSCATRRTEEKRRGDTVMATLDVVEASVRELVVC